MANLTETGTAHNKPHRQKHSKWLVMVYLAGDNNLSSNSISILQELEAADKSHDVRVIACFDSNTPIPKGARYVEINRGSGPSGHHHMNWALHNDLIPSEDLGAAIVYTPDFCSPERANVKKIDRPNTELGFGRFLEFVERNYTSEYRMLILFGHGTAVAGNTFLADDNPPSFMRLKPFSRLLKRYFNKGKKIDILACDNCVMNGIEMAYELRDSVEVMLGSEGLMLTVGWPYRDIIEVVNLFGCVQETQECIRKTVGKEILRKCARRLLDYTLMEVSSEQSLCDLSKLDGAEGLIAAIRGLSSALQEGLRIDPYSSTPLYREVCNAIRLARLEAQSYWDETFVDLFDFCKLLQHRCHEQYEDKFKFAKAVAKQVGARLKTENGTKYCNLDDERLLGFVTKDFLKQWEHIECLERICTTCTAVLNKIEEFVVSSYYVGPDLQYSHGVSIYFPWTLPQDPIIFDPIGVQYGSTNAPTRNRPQNYYLKSAFQEYCEYDFSRERVCDWSRTLESFFRATLRDVRICEYDHFPSNREEALVDNKIRSEPAPYPVSLQKSTSDTGRENGSACPSIKNYPRRFYLSPSDCVKSDCGKMPGDPEYDLLDPNHVSYLGWHIRGIVRHVIEPLSLEGDNGAE